MPQDEELLVQYGGSDPEFPLPAHALLDINQSCDDEWILERWRVMNICPRTAWFDEVGVAAVVDGSQL